MSSLVGGACPKCNGEIPQENYSTGQAMCNHCGWTDVSTIATVSSKTEKKNMALLIGGAVVMILAYGHLVSWGSYAFSAPFLKAGEMTGTLSREGYRELAQACIELNKWSCAKDAYLNLYKSKGDLNGVAELAHLQSRLGENEASVKTYASYISLGGKNGEAILRYGKVLETTNRFEEAMKMYEASIEARPEILPVHATTGIVRLLMKQGKYQEAKDRIIAFHASAGNAKGFLNTELTQLDNYFAENKNKDSGSKRPSSPRKAKTEEAEAPTETKIASEEDPMG